MKNNEILRQPLSSLNRVGPALTRLLTQLVGRDKVFDLLLHKPIRAEQISICPRLFEAQNDELVIVKAKVEAHVKPANPRQPYKIICYNPTGYITLVFFKIFPSQIAKMKIGSEIAILGNLQRLAGENQIAHPQEIVPISEIEKLPKLNVIYPLAAGITQKFLTQKIHEILARLPEKNDEWIDENFLKQQGWMSFGEALKNLHYFHPRGNFTHNPLPQEERELSIKRLAYDELLAWQIAVFFAKNNSQKNKKDLHPLAAQLVTSSQTRDLPLNGGKKDLHPLAAQLVTSSQTRDLPLNGGKFIAAEKNLAQEFLSQLPFQLTKAQLKSITEIEAEIFSYKKMLRLLQGDVGSGKTIVAIAACLAAISQQKQCSVIAPTTVLAKQHLAYFYKFLEKFKIRLALLTSATTKKQKSEILEKLSAGEIDILISTHAVLEDDVKFKNLGLAVIDEQHLFGVMQRLKLVEKGEDVDVLLMSATPIPRSLMMGLYGDMDISILNEKPKNRQKIETLIMSEEKSAELHEAMKRAVSRGEKIYWICPAIDEENEMELASVKKKFNELQKIFGEKNIGLLHGKMKEKEKEKVMADFAHGDLKILVSTTVIEVGIDVPDATVILIENSENFGLSQLHQLRGRVGRSEKKSFCILIYGKKFGANGRKRLNILRESNDGFFIAEEDLKMRGSGELLGTKQSGFPEFRIADLSRDADLLKIARKNAEIILHKNHETLAQKYQNLLQLFSYDDCLKMIYSG